MLTDKMKNWIREYMEDVYIKEDKVNLDDDIESFSKAVSMHLNTKALCDIGYSPAEAKLIVKSFDGLSTFEEDLRGVQTDFGFEERKDNFRNFSKVEPFAKIIMIIGKPSIFKSRLNGNPTEANKWLKNWTLSYTLTDGLGMYEFDKFLIKDSFTYQPQYYNVVNLRNEDSHLCTSWSEKALIQNITNILLVYLQISHKFAKEIDDFYKKCLIHQEFDPQEYCQCLIEEYIDKEKAGYKYIPVKWQKSVIDNTTRDSNIKELVAYFKGESINKIKIYGNAGCGKTSALEYLTYLDSQKVCSQGNRDAKIPVLIPMGKAEQNKSLIDMIAEQLRVNFDICNELLRLDKILLYLDGLNEILDMKVFRKIEKEIENLADKYAHITIVLTDRENKSQYGVTAFSCCTLLPFDNEDVLKFITGNTSIEYAGETVEISNNTRILLTNHIRQNFNYLCDKSPIVLQELLIVTDSENRVPEYGEITVLYLKRLLWREYAEKKDYSIPTMVSYLMALATSEQFIQGKDKGKCSVANALKIFAEIKNRYGYEENADTRKALKLALHLGILTLEEDVLRFSKEDYRQEFIVQGFKSDNAVLFF